MELLPKTEKCKYFIEINYYDSNVYLISIKENGLFDNLKLLVSTISKEGKSYFIFSRASERQTFLSSLLSKKLFPTYNDLNFQIFCFQRSKIESKTEMLTLLNTYPNEDRLGRMINMINNQFLSIKNYLHSFEFIDNEMPIVS